MARAFVAVRPPDPVLSDVGALVARVSDGVPVAARWTSPDQWHLTLQFLGNRVDLDGVAGALGALRVPGGGVRLGGGGAFPSERRAKVLWLGVVEGAQVLTELAGAVGALLAPVGYPPEDRPYHSHLTLARFSRPSDARPLVAAIGPDRVGERWHLGEVHLYESTTRPEGAEYRLHAAFPLG